VEVYHKRFAAWRHEIVRATVLFRIQMRVTSGKIRLACNLRGQRIVSPPYEKGLANYNEPVDEKKNRTLTGSVR